jgi:urease accessory protein
MLRLTRIIGHASDPELVERLHALSHKGRVEYLELSRDDTHRHRLRKETDKGTDCAVALDRAAQLDDGAILLLDDLRAVVVRMEESRWLRLQPKDTTTAVELGFLCGNLHWRVRFDGPVMAVALDGPEEDYLARLAPFLEKGRVERLADDD